MTSGKFAKSVLRLILISMLPATLAGCLQMSNTGIELGLSAPATKGVATACDLLDDTDVRASRKDTPETQRTLYELQQIKKRCDDGSDGRGTAKGP